MICTIWNALWQRGYQARASEAGMSVRGVDKADNSIECLVQSNAAARVQIHDDYLMQVVEAARIFNGLYPGPNRRLTQGSGLGADWVISSSKVRKMPPWKKTCFALTFSI